LSLDPGANLYYNQSITFHPDLSETERNMQDNWEKELSCANHCKRCNQAIEEKDRRILSVYDHLPICMQCKQEEEKRPDFDDASKQMPYGDPASYCFHHFCPFKCT
jgi:hypothetical protein